MMIVGKKKNTIVNVQQMTHMYVTSNTASVAADLTNGGHTNLGQYNSMLEAQTALEMVAKSIGNSEVFFMPSDNEVKAKINLKEQRRYTNSVNGRKLKSHGGS